MSDYFESIKKGAEEALSWKQGRKTGARVRQYMVMKENITNKEKVQMKSFSASITNAYRSKENE